METIILEIRDMEGGSDAKLLVSDMADIYMKYCSKNNIEIKQLESRSGFVKFWLRGQNIKKIFNNEIGGHRWQRVPPTEKRGRTQTSTVSVAVLDPAQEVNITLHDDEIDIRFFSGTGAGGQHRNRKQCSVMMTHLKTQVVVKVEGRSKESNIEEAKRIMVQRLKEHAQEQYDMKYSTIRKDQIGDTFRGNKRRTYNEKANEVVDHINNKKCTIKDIFKGNITVLHK